MRPLRAQAVASVSELKASPATIVKAVTDDGPMVITVDGKAAAVVLAPADYDDLVLWASIGRGLADSQAGRVVPHDEVVQKFKARAAAREVAPVAPKTAAK